MGDDDILRGCTLAEFAQNLLDGHPRATNHGLAEHDLGTGLDAVAGWHGYTIVKVSPA